MIDVATIISNAFTTSTTITLLNGLAQGTDYINRIGARTVLRSIWMQSVITNTAGYSSGITNTYCQGCRVLVVFDTQTNGALPAVSSILTSGTTTSPLNINNRDRFRVLLDKRIGVFGDSTSKPVYVNKFMKCNLQTVYGGTGATVAAINTGGMYLVTVGDIAIGGGTPGNDYQYYIRLRFTDD